VVREAACLAIGQLSDHMTEQMALHHVHVIQAVIACMEQPSSTVKVQRKLCLAIEALCTELDRFRFFSFFNVFLIVSKIVVPASNTCQC
jgi:hypothetical protein